MGKVCERVDEGNERIGDHEHYLALLANAEYAKAHMFLSRLMKLSRLHCICVYIWVG